MRSAAAQKRARVKRPAKRVDHLDGIRALAILGVLATHWVDAYVPIGSGGHIGVDLFFVLSGFIITTILWRSAPAASVTSGVTTFLRRRVRRLYPALVGLVVGCIALAALSPIGPYGPVDVAGQGVLVLAQVSWWDLAHGTVDTVFGHTWSLGVEWAFYLVWPWVILLLRRRGVTARRACLASVALALALYAGSFGLDEHAFTYSPLGRVSGIVAGAALALWMVDGERRSPRSVRTADAVAALVLVAYLGYVLVGYPTFDPGVRTVGLPLAVACACYLTWFGYTRTTGPVLRLLTAAPVTLVGRCSYSLYLWHIPPLLILDKDRVDLPVLLLGALGVGFAAVATTLSYVLLERPFASSRASVLRTGAVETADVLPRDLEPDPRSA